MPPDSLHTFPNTFQQLMLQWERLAPYNAGQYMTLAGTIDVSPASAAWRDVVIALGLQQVGQHPDAPLRTDARRQASAMSPSNAPTASIESFITAELNRPFAAGDSPFRPFAFSADSDTHIGIIYRHAVADSASIRLVMRAWFDRLNGRRLPGHVAIARDLRDREPFWTTVKAALREFPRVARAKRVRRLPADRADPTSAVVWRPLALPDGTIDRALRFARRAGVKLNDVFLAAAALACDAHLPCEGSDVRQELGVGTIVDVRPADRPAQTNFGLSLGFLQTFWRPQDLRSFDAAMRVAARVSRSARERGDAGASRLRLAIAERLGRGIGNVELADFYRKRCPLAAGISNVNLSRDWPAAFHPSPLLDYTRVSPLGPMLPLVFTPTTLGTIGKMGANMGVTYRSSVIDEPTADAVIAAFVNRLIALR